MDQIIEDMLKNKDILLYGVCDEAVEFFANFQDVLNIKFCISNYSEDVKLQEFDVYGLDTVLYDDIQIGENDYIIICDSSHFRSFERRLQIDGIRAYEQYVSVEIATAILQEKKIVVLMGSQCVYQLSCAMNSIDKIARGYMVYCFLESELLKTYKSRMAEYQHVAACADVYIYSVCDKSMYNAKVLSKSHFIKDCIIISISDYTFNGYFPQIDNNRDQYSKFLFRERERFPIPYYTLALAREDNNLSTAVMNEETVEEIISKVSDINFYSKDFIHRHYKQAIERIREADIESDIKLAKYLELNGQNKVTYRNIDEWNVDILHYVLHCVFEYINEKVEVSPQMLMETLEENSGSELPVYPSVLYHLGLDEYKDKKYRVVSYYSTKYLDFEEYIRYCVESMYQIKDLYEFLGVEGE